MSSEPQSLTTKNVKAAQHDRQNCDYSVDIPTTSLVFARDEQPMGSTNGPRRCSGLSVKYQAAYSKVISHAADAGASSVGFVDSSLSTLKATPLTNQWVDSNSKEPSMDTSFVIQSGNWNNDDDDDLLMDYTIPPSAQIPKALDETRIMSQGKIPEDLSLIKPSLLNEFEYIEAIEDQEDDGEYFIDDTRIADFTDPVVCPDAAVQGTLGDNWRSSFFDDESLLGDIETIDHSSDTLNMRQCLSNIDKEGKIKTSARHGKNSNCLPPGNPPSPCVLMPVSGNAAKQYLDRAGLSEGSEHCFDDDDLDKELADLTHNSDALGIPTPRTSPAKPTIPKLQWMPPTVYTPAKSTQVPTSLLDVPHLVPTNAQGEALPFMRPPFPKAIRDRSPILGLTNRTVLRTCFRIGEALNATAIASRTNVDAIIELYARVVSSKRENEGGYKQSFQFGDLFTNKPPYLSATYSLWKDVGLWDQDSKVFVGEGRRNKLARVMGRIKRNVQGADCEMTIMSIWEVDWEDIGIAKGIVCS